MGANRKKSRYFSLSQLRTNESGRENHHAALPALFLHSNAPGLGQLYDKARAVFAQNTIEQETERFKRDALLHKSLIASLKQKIIETYLVKLKENGLGVVVGKPFLKIQLNSSGEIKDIEFTQKADQIVEKYLTEVVLYIIEKENLWQNMMRWTWSISIPWAVNMLEKRWGCATLLEMPEERWVKLLDQAMNESVEHLTYRRVICKQKMVKIILDALKLVERSTADIEALLGLKPIEYTVSPALKAGLERSGYLTIFNSALYQQLRSAIGSKSFLNTTAEDWPTAVLDTPKGTVKGVAQIRPGFEFFVAGLPGPIREQYLEEMSRMAQDMDDETADVLDIICHVWLKTASSQEELITITADDLLSLRGLKEQKNGSGRRGGYKDEWRRRMAGHMERLKRIWIKAEYDVMKDPEGSAFSNRQMGREHANSSAVIISDVYGPVIDEGKPEPYTWRVRPGDPLVKDILGSRKQTAILSRTVLTFDPYRQALEKRTARYLAWQWRNRQSRMLYMEPFRVSTIMDRIGLQINHSRPSKTIERFEKMMDVLHEQGIISGWQYSEAYEKWREWIDLKIIIEPPQDIVDHYVRIRTKGGKNKAKLPAREVKPTLPKGFYPDELKNERQKRRLSQMQAAEQMGIDQTTFSRLENGKIIPNNKMLNLVKKWMQK